MGLLIKKRKFSILFLLMMLSSIGSFGNINQVGDSNYELDTILEHPLPGINDWDPVINIHEGNWAKIVPSTAGQYQLFVDWYYTYMYTSTDLINWHNEILIEKAFEDYIWDGSQFIAWDDIIDRLYTIQLDGTRASSFDDRDMAVVANHGFWKKNDNTIQFAYDCTNSYNCPISWNGIQFGRVIGNTMSTYVFTGIDPTPGYGFDMLHDSSDTYHLLYYDGDTKIKSTTGDWSIGVVNTVATGYGPEYIFEYNNGLLVILSKSVISSVDGFSHKELFYATSNDAITWTTPEQMSPDNGHDKFNAQILPMEDGSFVLQYMHDFNIYLTRSSELLSAVVTAPSEKIGLGDSATFTSHGKFSNNTDIADTNVLWEVYYPNRTLWFSWMGMSDTSGNDDFSINMPVNAPGGYYYIKAQYQVTDYGIAVATSKFSYLYRDYAIPLFIDTPNVTINSNVAEITVSGRFDDSVTQFWITLSILDPLNYPYQSVTISPFLYGNYSQLIIFDLDQGMHDGVPSGIYQCQLIFRLAPPKDGSEVIDFINFNISI